MTQVPNNIYSLFISKLKATFGETLQFPETICFDTVYKVVDPKAIEHRKLRGHWEISFMVINPGKPYMDYYAAGDDYSSHQRMDEKGNIADLENFKGQFGWPVYEDEQKTREAHKAIKEHNQEVQQILLSKGFMK